MNDEGAEPVAPAPAQPPAAPAAPVDDPAATLRSRPFVVLLTMATAVGFVISVAAWGFLEAIQHIQEGVFDHLPDALGFDTVPWWWPVPVLAVAGLVVAVAVERLPGRGGHVPVEGLKVGSTQPIDLPGILLAAFATIGLGVVLGPESPIIALGAGLTVWLVTLGKRDAPAPILMVLAAAGSFAAISAVFDSPMIAAVLLIEATGLGGPTLPLILLPGLLGAGLGSLMFTGIGSWSGLNTSAYSLGRLDLPAFARPSVSEVAWTVALGLAAAVFTVVVRRIGFASKVPSERRPFVVLPVAGIVIALLAIAFEQLTDHGSNEVLFSGQDALPGLVSGASSWSIGALALLLVAKGLAWGISLGGFRGGPTFPGMFLGAAGGILASHLPGLSVTPAVAVGVGAMVAAVLKLPLSAVVLATVLTGGSGLGVQPVIILGVVVAYVATVRLEHLVANTKARQDPDEPVGAGPQRGTEAALPTRSAAAGRP